MEFHVSQNTFGSLDKGLILQPFVMNTLCHFGIGLNSSEIISKKHLIISQQQSGERHRSDDEGKEVTVRVILTV